ncbi:von Willebrand factor A domain-containing protein 8 isoform X2 [Planococcus citri]
MITAVRRINTINRIILRKSHLKNFVNQDKIVLNNTCSMFCRHEGTAAGKVKIGDVEKIIKNPTRPEYVPVNYLSKDLTQSILSDLKWMLQKDELKQDMFLIGQPGSWRRQLVMAYLQLTQQEVEFVSLSRDTTEADLKQRREIIKGSAEYINQSAVRAAIEGRILVLEGIEKAERNVLPVLNNLLENREMHLEDGRFLIAPDNYDKLFKEHGEEYLKKWNLIRVHDDFRVIALGLPVPNYPGNPLDPPLRSRFQCRDINAPPYQEMKILLQSAYPSCPSNKLEQLLSCGYALVTQESKIIGLPDFPIDNCRYIARLLEVDPSIDVADLFTRLYPYKSILLKEGQSAVSNILKSFKVQSINDLSDLRIVDKKTIDVDKAVIYLNNNSVIELRTGQNLRPVNQSEFVDLPYHSHQLANLMRTHAVGDFCVVGPSGCGKSIIVRKFAEMLNYQIEPVILYQDMTSRDLIQQRETMPNGDTVWRNSPLVNAALEGKLAILDGIHRVHTSTLAVLNRLINDRELQLHDGQRLLRHDRYDELASIHGEDYLKENGIHRIHPSFRIIALAEKPGGYNLQWMTAEIVNFFIFHEIRALNPPEELQLIEALNGQCDPVIKSLLDVVQKLRSSPDPALSALSASLSTRQLLRIAKRFSKFSSRDIFETIQRACLAKFLPPLTRQALDTALFKAGVHPLPTTFPDPKECKIQDQNVVIGDTIVPRYQTNDSAKVPNVLFYDLPQHTELLEQLLQDFSINEHLLLVGNQGVGKNKLTDKLLQMLNRPREYIQLHRDTTVQSLTMQPMILDGKVWYDDSPLVKAVQRGHVLVVDEADKAPTHVTCILKTLIESGEMILSDGRRIVPANSSYPDDPKILRMHPDFRMIVLANRPGFPFLGNNLFAALGDLFSCHIIDNPKPESEIQLLQQYGPDVNVDIIRRIVNAFGELRELADKGMVSYPYSTREAVNIVKHLQAFPNDSITEAISNVFDFDRYSSDMREILQRVLNDHRIPVQLVGIRKKTAEDLQLTVERNSGLDVSGPKHGKTDEKNDPHVGGNTWAGGTGGRDTAGLGGKGGPYRLDAGHTVHQLSDAEKEAVPEHIKKAAREMGQKAFKERLKEIQMSEYDAKVYNEFSIPVQKQVQALRVILSNLQAKSKERQWTRHQTSGELDDAKLVEGITGERTIYRRRTDVEPELGAPQIKPKRLRLVVDVSGSMYRFNGYDGRLDREMEAVILVLEALQGHESRIQYDIVGHSGEAYNITFVSKKNPPSDNKQRLDVIKTMHAHAQFCMSGDNTLEAIEDAVKRLEKEKEEFDEGIVIVLSDANLSRYGIPPRNLAKALQSSDTVSAYAIFIGSLGDQAVKLTNALPAGRGFVCMNLEDIPQIIQQIFTSSLLRTNK